MISTHPRVGVNLLVRVRVKAKVWALPRRDAHSFGLGRIQISVVFVSDYIGVSYRIISDYIGLYRFSAGLVDIMSDS